MRHQRPEELPQTFNGATIYEWAEVARFLKQQLEQAWEAERVAIRERDVAREEADVLEERLRYYEGKLESLTL